jgi:hypothetical protein
MPHNVLSCLLRGHRQTEQGIGFVRPIDLAAPPLPNVSIDSMKFAVSAKPHVMARVNGVPPSAVKGSASSAARAHTGDARETRGKAKQAAPMSGASVSAAERMAAFIGDRVPAEDHRGLDAALEAAQKARRKGKSKVATHKRKAARAPKADAAEADVDPQSWDGPRLSFEMMRTDPKVRDACNALTLMPDADSFLSFYELLNANGQAERLQLYDYRGDGNVAGRGAGDGPKQVRPGARAMKAEDAYFMTLVMLANGMKRQITGLLFNVHEKTLMPYFITWVQFLKKFLQQLMPHPTKQQIEETSPPEYKEVYGGVNPAQILDAMEMALENPTDLENYRACFSQYKHRTTAKVLGGISPAGAFIYASDAYPGRISDKQLTEVSGVMDLLEEGDAVAADKGFQIEDLMHSIGCVAIFPPKRRRGETQHTTEAAMDTARQANLRIHVERAFARVKKYRYLSQMQKIATCDMLGSVFYVVAMMTNFNLPLVSRDWREVTAERFGAAAYAEADEPPPKKKRKSAAKSRPKPTAAKLPAESAAKPVLAESAAKPVAKSATKAAGKLAAKPVAQVAAQVAAKSAAKPVAILVANTQAAKRAAKVVAKSVSFDLSDSDSESEEEAMPALSVWEAREKRQQALQRAAIFD